MRPKRFPAWLAGVAGILGALLWFARETAAQPSPYTPYQHRAWYIYLIAQYTEWPAEAFPNAAAPFVLGILGEDPFRQDIAVIRDKPLKNRKLEIRYCKSVEEAQQCQALYIADSEKEKLPRILKALDSTSVLTFSEIPGFLQEGGMVKFWISEKTVSEGFLLFQVNETATTKARLRISSRVLKLAKPEKIPD